MSAVVINILEGIHFRQNVYDMVLLGKQGIWEDYFKKSEDI